MESENVDALSLCVWGNNTKIIPNNKKKTKPCFSCGHCPYGCMVEAFPLHQGNEELSCPVFGHDCPMYYNGEDLSEFGERRIKEVMENVKGTIS